uniref:L1 transposable element RRM domain-containing protein n=1 Tax=Canis lupus familiaris TaxID=9615 RepID=A0A8C0N314_CANLF
QHLRAQESAPSSLRAAARTAGPGGTRSSWRGSGGGSAEGAARPREQLGGARAEEEAPCGGGCAVPGAARRDLGGGSAEGAAGPGSANPPAQAPEHRAPGRSPGSGLPRDRQRPGGPRTARTLLPGAEQISGPAPEPPGPADGVPAGAESRFPELPQPLGLFLLRPHGVNNPHRALHQAGAEQLPQLLTPENQHNRPLPQKTSGTDNFQEKPRDLKYTESEDTPRWFFFCLFVFVFVLFCFLICFLPPPPFFLLSFSFSFSSFFFFRFFFFFFPFFFSFSFLSFFLSSLFLFFPIQLAFGHSALSKMTRRKTSPQKKESETVLSPTELQNLDYNSMSESQFRSTIIQLLVALEKSIKDSRDFMTAEFRANQAEIKNQLNEMQSKLEVLTTRVNEVEERVSDLEDKLIAQRETEEKRDKQLKDHEDRLREINDSLRKKNLRLIGVPEGAERDRGPEYVFEQILAENFPNLGRETGIQIQEIERSPPKINKNRSTPRHLIVKLANSKDKEKILKAARDKKSLTFMGRSIRVTADLSTETWQARKGWQDIFRVLNEKNMQPRILYPARLSFKMEGEIKSFQDRQQLKEYVTSKPALQEILRGPLKIPL